MNSKQIIQEMLDKAGVQINGPHPFDVQVHNEKLYDRILAQGTLGLGEAYMDGWWDAEALDETIFRCIRAGGETLIAQNISTTTHALKARVLNMQTKIRATQVTDEHYDIGDDLYMAMLGPYSQYTCAYFKDTTDLNIAQQQKMDLIAQKIHLSPGDEVLDIGCGWGGLALWFAERYGCKVTGVNLAAGQVKYAQEHIQHPNVQILSMDYRDVRKLNKKFDKITSVGMMEHVGYKNHRTMLKAVKELLKPEGLFLLHHCGSDISMATSNPWITKYIFPGAVIPSMAQIAKAADGLFVMEDWHNIGPHYDPTLMGWYKNFNASWPQFKDQYGDRFYRMFRYYLLICAGGFRARDMELWQMVFSHNGIVGGYKCIR